MNGEREAALVLQDHLASHNQHDLVLWLAAENECLRRALRNDRETIASLRGQLRCAHNALRTLHTQGAGSRGQDTVEEHHRYLIAQLSNLDRLALDWARRSEELAAESRELCQLRVEHAQVLEASQALRKAHEATINSLQSKLDSLEAQYTEAESTTISLRATCKELSAQMAALSKRPNVSQRDLAVIELETDGHIVAIEAHIQDTERLLSSLECAVPPRLHQLLHQVAEGRTAISKESDARKQRDSQVKHLMKLIRDLEERNGQALKKLEAVEEERISMQLSASDSIRKLEEKDLVIQHLDLQCEAYERELKSSKGARSAGNLRQSVPMPLGVSNVENRQSKRESPRLASMPKAKTKTKTAAAPRSKCPGDRPYPQSVWCMFRSACSWAVVRICSLAKSINRGGSACRCACISGRRVRISSTRNSSTFSHSKALLTPTPAAKQAENRRGEGREEGQRSGGRGQGRGREQACRARQGRLVRLFSS